MKQAGAFPDNITPGIRLWLSQSGTGVLDAIHKTGSLQAAAAALGISYRKAWGDLRKAEKALGVSLIERHRGGAAGGNSSLTEEGKRWQREYARFQNEVDAHLDKAFARFRKRMEK
jgi:molybdate transport system regulatory protein